jgi:outer membrane protein TolC
MRAASIPISILALLSMWTTTCLGQTAQPRQSSLDSAKGRRSSATANNASAPGAPSRCRELTAAALQIEQPPETIAPGTPQCPLSLADLEAIALGNNPTLAQAAAQVRASRGAALEAGLYPNPIVGYEAEQIGAAGTPGEFQGGFVQQTIVTAGKLRLSRAKYSQEAYEAQILAMGQQLVVLNGVRMRFYEVLADQRMVELRRELLLNAEENLRTTREMFNTGLANESDVLLAEVEVNRAQIDLADEENSLVAG